MAEEKSRMVVIDTNIFIDYLRNFPPALFFFESLSGHEDAVLFSAITEAELLAGKKNADAQKREVLLHFLHAWNKILVTNPIALLAGDLAREYNLEIPDAILAATAMLSDAVLITRDEKDFRKIARLSVRVPY